MCTSRILQEAGDHLVWNENDIVKKTPIGSRLNFCQAQQSIDFFKYWFPEFTPPTLITPLDSGQSYCIVQAYIAGENLGSYIESGKEIKDDIRLNLQRFSKRAMDVLDETGVVFDIIGYPYGLKRGELKQSSNIIITTDGSIQIVDNILTSGNIGKAPWQLKLENKLLKGKSIRAKRFTDLLNQLNLL